MDDVHLRPAVRSVLAPLLVLALVLAGALWAGGRGADARAPMAAALDALPAGTQVAGFTDWAAVRRSLDLGDGTGARVRGALTDDAALRDLTTRSVLGQLVDDMRRTYRWSVADLDWEVYGQSSAGSALVARLSGTVSTDEVREGLRRLGYRRSGTTWSITDAARSAVGVELSGTLAHVAVVDHPALVVAADRPAYVRSVLDTVDGDARSLLSVRPAADVAASLPGSTTAVLQAPTFGCQATSLGGADEDVAAQAAAALARAGTLRRPTFTGRGLVDGRPRQTIRFAAAFASPGAAAEQARVRAALATGPFIGRTGRVEDSLVLQQAAARGSVATLRFGLDPDRGAYMAADGPVLFASCP